MKNVKKMAAQGDVMFLRLESMPEGVTQDKAKGPLVVAHSETGHHHVLEGGKLVELFRGQDATICYLRIANGPADVVHHRPFDTHETLRLAPGIWEVRRQREATPEGWRQVAD